jgi:glutaredoxin-related protein
MIIYKKILATTSLAVLIVLMLATVLIGSRNSKEEVLTTEVKLSGEETSVEVASEVNILYWGTTCPHCHDVIEWIENNKIDEEINIELKEVYQNRQNFLELVSKSKGCGFDENSIAVPFMFTSKGDCLIGTPDIIGYLLGEVQQISRSDAATPPDQENEAGDL